MKTKILTTAFLISAILFATANTVRADDTVTLYRAKATCYCHSGNLTATQTVPTEGRTVASKREYFGKTMMIWLDDGDGIVKPQNFLGAYVVEDTAGKDSPIRRGLVIDIFKADRGRCLEFGCKRIIYQIVESEG